ncbi:MAG: deaminase, partial [Phycisphaerae bacterium]
MERSDEDYMKMALREAQYAMDQDEVPIGCVIVCGGQIIARGYNLVEKL